MEQEIPVGRRPPPHRHDWDEAYFVIDGALDFEVAGSLTDRFDVVMYRDPAAWGACAPRHGGQHRAATW